MIASDYIAGVLNRNRATLARAITLIESDAPRDAPIAEEVIDALTPHAGNSIRVGITGSPGVGKSTFIEALGCLLCKEGRRVAVLAVDPSSSITRGSILGDKTRMEMLVREPGCFIRPSPSNGALGGVARKSRETILLCEAAGYEVILMETVGVGQSEITVRSMVDFFLVLMLAGAGDELQGIKRGILELADALLITKADGDNLGPVELARAEFTRALHYLQPNTQDWHVEVLSCSSTEGTGVHEVWQLIERFRESSATSGLLTRRRAAQSLDWMREILRHELWARFSRNPIVIRELRAAERHVLRTKLSPASAVKRLFDALGMQDLDLPREP